MASFDWGAAAGGAQDALQQMLEQRILQERMALAQRQQAAEEQHRAAMLAEQQAARGEQGRQFNARLGLDTRELEEVKKPGTLAGVRLNTATAARTEQQTAQDAAREKARAEALAKLAANPETAPFVDFTNADIPIGATDPTDVTGERDFGRRVKLTQIQGDQNVRAAEARGVGGTRPMTQGQRAALSAGLRKDYNANVKGARTIDTQVQMMNEGWKNYDVNPNAASQAILVTFQKILDPNSVVRESEYARSFDGSPLHARMMGAWKRLEEGGAGIPKSQLEGFKQLAERFAAGYAKKAQEYQSVIDANADEFGIDKRLIYSEGEFQEPNVNEPETAAVGGPAVGTERMINGVPAVWDGKGWKRK